MKRVFIFVFLALLIGGGYVAYDRWFSSSDTSAWDFIPKHAALILEAPSSLAGYDSLKKNPVWSVVSQMEALISWEKSLGVLDSIDSEVALVTVLNSRALIAAFPVTASRMDVLYVFPLSSGPQRAYLKKVEEHFETKKYRYKERIYDGFTISEYYKSPDARMFSFVLTDGFLVGSFTPFLVEDAIRTYNQPEELAFEQAHASILAIKPLNQDDGNVFVNLKEFGSLLNLFPTQRLEELSGSAFLDIDLKSDHFKLSGFTFPSSGLLSTFTSPPVSFDLLDVIPNNVSLVRHFSFDDSKAWRNELLKVNPGIRSGAQQMKNRYDLDMDFFFEQITSELAVANVEAVRNESPDKLVFFAVSDPRTTSDFLEQAALRMASDSVFKDYEGEYEIGKLDVDFAAGLLGDMTSMETECYYMIHQNFAILSSSIAELRKLIESIGIDETWRKSIKVNRLLDLSSREANYSLIINVPRYWNQGMELLKPEWRTFFGQNEGTLKSLEFLAIQFNLVEDKYFTSLVGYQPESPRVLAESSVKDQVAIPYPIISKPFVHRSHLNQSLEVFLQDSAHQLYHFSSGLDILWTKPLSGPLTSPVLAVDFYNNQKKQYAFLVGNELHIHDRNGAELDGFPRKVPSDRPVVTFSVVDYDGSKNYRFMFSDDQGRIYLMDKTGIVLDGWNPKPTGWKLTAGPRHIRVAGKDAFIIMDKNRINLINRRGDSYRGFPVEFQEPLVGQYFASPTGDFSTSTITTLTTAGEIIRVDFTGQIKMRKQLYKPELNSTFDLIPDVLNNTFIITRRTGGLWEVLDSSGEKLFEKPYIKENSTTSFYHFGGSRTIIFSVDESEGLISAFDLNGNAVNRSALKSSNPVSILHFANEGVYEIYLTEGKELRKVWVK